MKETDARDQFPVLVKWLTEISVDSERKLPVDKEMLGYLTDGFRSRLELWLRGAIAEMDPSEIRDQIFILEIEYRNVIDHIQQVTGGILMSFIKVLSGEDAPIKSLPMNLNLEGLFMATQEKGGSCEPRVYDGLKLGMEYCRDSKFSKKSTELLLVFCESALAALKIKPSGIEYLINKMLNEDLDEILITEDGTSKFPEHLA